MSAIIPSAAVNSSTTTRSVGPAAAAASSSALAGTTRFSSVVVAASTSSAAAASSSTAVASSETSSSASSSVSSPSSSHLTPSVVVAAASAVPSSAEGATTTAASSSMSAGTIGGIIGGVVGGLALFALAVFLWKKWRSRAEREQYPLPPPRSIMSHRPSSVAGSAMLGHAPRRMSSGNLLMASAGSRQSFGQPSPSGFASRRGSTYSTLAPPRPLYSGSSASAPGSQSVLGSTPDSSEVASRTSIDHSASSSAGPSAGQSPELSVADGWLATDVDLPPVAGPSNDTGRSSPSASSSAGHGIEGGSSSSRSSSSAAATAAAAGLPVPPMPMSPAGGQPRHQLRISTSSLGPSHQQYRREPSTARYSISSLSSARSFGQGGSFPSAGGVKASGTPHGGRRVELTMPAPLGPADEWGLPDSRQYSASAAGGKSSQRGSTTPTTGAGPTAARSDEHGRLN